MSNIIVRWSRAHRERYHRLLNRRFGGLPAPVRNVAVKALEPLGLERHRQQGSLPPHISLLRFVFRLLKLKWKILRWKFRLLHVLVRVKWKLLKLKWAFLKWYWGLPWPLKIGKIIVLIIIMGAYNLYQYEMREQEKDVIFNQYYPYYYSVYRKTLPESQAARYAAHYARYYADYYTSDAYKQSLSYALPEASEEALAYSSDSVNASLTLTQKAPSQAPAIREEPPPVMQKPVAREEKIIKELPPELSTPAPPQKVETASLPPALPEKIPAPELVPSEIHRDGIALIKHFEGFRSKPYLDSGGRMTIGYGHLVRRGEFWTEISHEEAEKLLLQDIKLAEAAVKRMVQVPLSHNQFAALVSLVFNIGPHKFEESTLLKKLNERDFAAAAREFPRWKHVGKQEVAGLSRRRTAERNLFLSA